jgi:hypothetical protein
MTCKLEIRMVNEIPHENCAACSERNTFQTSTGLWTEWRNFVMVILWLIACYRRSWLACAVALAVDGLQLLLGPMGWWGVDQGLDIVAMVFITLAIGFHPLLLPTFVAEFVPALDMLPTWTACTFMVIGLRRKQNVPPPPPSQTPGPPIIDI